MIEIRTERLILRRPTDADLDELAAMNADPEVMRYIGRGVTRTREETAAGLARVHAEWEAQGRGMFALELCASGRFVGWVALTEPAFLPEILPAVEIGWRLAREHWGQGYATEAPRQALRFGFDDCGLDRVVSIRHVDNRASQRVMEKLGLRPERQTVVPATDQPVVVHELTRSGYRSHRTEVE